MANAEAGKYLKDNFVATYQKVGTFTINGGQKQGGNVASYFCTPEGRVLHAIAGPVNADVLLREARWVVEASKLASLDGKKSDVQLRAFWLNAHCDRLHHEHHLDIAAPPLSPPISGVDKGGEQRRLHLNNEGKVHLLLATAPLPRLEQVYKLVFEKILNEKVSTAPVVQVGG